MKNLLKVILLFLIVSADGYAQETFWNAGLYSFFDNTEFGHSSYQIPQTMAGVRFAPELGLRWDSVNSITLGCNMLHEFGSARAIGDFFPSAYYQFDKKPFRFLMGAFPRSYAVERYPRIFFQDSLTYYRPNINGMLWEYYSGKLFLNLWLDWTSRQSVEAHEAFFMGFSGKYQYGILYLQEFTYMFHFAGRMNPVVDEALHDNGLVHTSAGLDFSDLSVFTRLEINAGWIAGLDRARSDNTGWIVQHGFLSEARIEFKRIGLFNTFYAGNGQMHYYDDHDNELYWGDPIYRAKTYNRSDFYIDFIKDNTISTRLIYSLHFAENTIYHEQALKVSVNLNALRFKR
ncbi:MAG: hypothetical protein QG576_1050 [Bacteroidota bacterium]|nr:hypothetical protein [Bacteroidota bacterium]